MENQTKILHYLQSQDHVLRKSGPWYAVWVILCMAKLEFERSFLQLQDGREEGGSLLDIPKVLKNNKLGVSKKLHPLIT